MYVVCALCMSQNNLIECSNFCGILKHSILWILNKRICIVHTYMKGKIWGWGNFNFIFFSEKMVLVYTICYQSSCFWYKRLDLLLFIMDLLIVVLLKNKEPKKTITQTNWSVFRIEKVFEIIIIQQVTSHDY